jgi:carbon monoxide dehydrogenase subunit G
MESPTRYHFRHSFAVGAAPERVQAVLVDLEHYPQWWPQVRAVLSLGPDTAMVVCRSVLPYDLELVLDSVRRDPDCLEARIDGPISGFARWHLTATGSGTRLDFEQEVHTRGRLLALASYVARPLLRWNHTVMMRGCARGLEARFSVPGDRTSGPSS